MNSSDLIFNFKYNNYNKLLIKFNSTYNLIQIDDTKKVAVKSDNKIIIYIPKCYRT